MQNEWNRRGSFVLRSRRTPGCQMLPLESRLLLSGTLEQEHLGPEITPLPAMDLSPAATATSSPAAAGSPLSSIPALHSLPGAYAKLYLDFDGDYSSSWLSYTPGKTPAFDQDGDVNTFSSAELNAIREIWTRVAEAFSPFRLDVTTVNPGTLADRQVFRVVLGGDGTWFSADPVGGVAYVGSFSNYMPNTAYVYTDNLANGHAKYSALAAVHEAGHGFGLDHQALWSGSTLVDEYYAGNNLVAPLMGYNYDGARALWWKGTTPMAPNDIQDDMSKLASSSNGFGFRTDDRGNSASTARALSVSASTLTGNGVIEKTSDLDFFSFYTAAGTIRLTASPAAKGGMLDLKLDLYRANGTLLKSVNTSSLGETMSLSVTAGKYFLRVASRGRYGDVGQYAINGSIVPTSGTNDYTSTQTRPAAPTNLRPYSMNDGRVKLMWRDNSSNESGFKLERSTDKRNWITLRNILPNTTATVVGSTIQNTSFYYRLRAFNKAGFSAYSNLVYAQTTITRTSTGSRYSYTFSYAPLPRNAATPAPGNPVLLASAAPMLQSPADLFNRG